MAEKFKCSCMETRPVYTLNLAEKIEFMDLQEMGGGCGDWMELAQDRDRWRALVSTVMNLGVPKMREIF